MVILLLYFVVNILGPLKFEINGITYQKLVDKKRKRSYEYWKRHCKSMILLIVFEYKLLSMAYIFVTS